MNNKIVLLSISTERRNHNRRSTKSGDNRCGITSVFLLSVEMTTKHKKKDIHNEYPFFKKL